ncbi:hypothetical protein L1987_86189 [Smallanthus sonchifolius]|uniref:Uncharacterized protein n=1 Tax=Smallanthus sonchifolius TaxID=185202 RepID=A0ACB8XZF2_9ASTR|nr:hypothetical protein L1987_86189 [Smallanthus sonchifolius]
MEDEPCLSPVVKATLCLGSETHSIEACKGTLSEQLVFVKGESMNILKEFITKHNVPNDVPDEISSEDDDDDDGEGPAVVSKKSRDVVQSSPLLCMLLHGFTERAIRIATAMEELNQSYFIFSAHSCSCPVSRP